MDFENITLFPELIEDLILFIIIAVLLGLVSKIIFDWKEKRRLDKEYAEYQQRREDERNAEQDEKA